MNGTQDHKDDHREQVIYPAEKARQGEIILRTRTQRAIFIAGLVGIVIVALVMTLLLR